MQSCPRSVTSLPINWLTSYSLYKEILDPWFDANVAPDFVAMRERAMDMLQVESELQEIVQLVGSDSLPDEQQLLLEITRMVGKSSCSRTHSTR